MPALDFMRNQYREKSCDAGDEAILHWQSIPPKAYLRFQDFYIAGTGKTNVSLDATQPLDISCWWLPVFDDEQHQSFSTEAHIKALYDRRVPKVLDGTNVGAPDDAWTPTQNDVALGDVDTSLYYRPDRISLSVLANAGEPAKLYGQRIWLGFLEEKAFRQATTQCRYAFTLGGFVNKGINARSGPGYVVWVVGIPPKPDRTEFPDTALFPEGGDWDKWDFLAPAWDPIHMGRSPRGSDLDDWRKWAVHYQTNSTAADSMWTESNMRFRMALNPSYPRQQDQRRVVSPQD